jgi:hypothetical protein
VLLAAWWGFAIGAGPFYQVVGANIRAIPSDLANIAELSRTGFLTSGGSTNVVVPLREDAAPGMARASELDAYQRATTAYQHRLAQKKSHNLFAHSQIPAIGLLAPVTSEGNEEATNRLHEAQLGAGFLPPGVAVPASFRKAPAQAKPVPPPAAEFRAVPITVLDHLRAAVFGLAVVFVPISVLKAIVGLGISGGRGLLAIADLDTVFLDLTTVAVFALLWTRRHTIGDRLPFVVFALILATTSAFLLGYVVTNYGTLWRLRSTVAIPLWILVVALSPRVEPRRELAARTPVVTQA